VGGRSSASSSFRSGTPRSSSQDGNASASRPTCSPAAKWKQDHPVVQIGPRKRALTVQRRFERHDDLGHRRRVGGDDGCGEGALHVNGTLSHQGIPQLLP
jgi:hypothetical protein